jgi:phosphoribosylformylglycinamidine (FGAM) synthase-like amidotransferase family enzyme
MNKNELIRIYPNELSVNKPVEFDIYSANRNLLKKTGDIIDPGFMLKINFLKIYKMQNDDINYSPLDDLLVSEYNQKLLLNNINDKQGIYLVACEKQSGKTVILESLLQYLNYQEIDAILINNNYNDSYNIEHYDISKMDDDRIIETIDAAINSKKPVIGIDNVCNPTLINKIFELTPPNKTIILTFNANNSIEAIEKLQKIIAKNTFFKKISGILSQKLSLALCHNCKEKYQADNKEINKFLNCNADDIIHLYKPSGCEICNNTGYYGDLGIQEFLTITESIKENIANNFDTKEISKLAFESNFQNMNYDCLKKVLCGLIPLAYYARISQK